MPPRKKAATPAATLALPGAPPWAAAAVRQNADDLIRAAGAADRMPTRAAGPTPAGPRALRSCEFVTGSEGIVFLLTADAHEAGFFAATLAEPRPPAGVVEVGVVAKLPPRGSPDRLFVLWREATLPKPDLATWEKVGPFRRFLSLFGRASAEAVRLAEAAEDRGRFAAAAWDRARDQYRRLTLDQIEGAAAWQTALRSRRGEDRCAYAISAARLCARHLEQTPGGELVGHALGFWLDRGLLLDGLGGEHLGMARRGAIAKAVIVRPGRPYLLDDRYGQLSIPPLAEAVPWAMTRRSNPGFDVEAVRAIAARERAACLRGRRPQGRCWDVSRRVARALSDELGLEGEVVTGLVRVDEPTGEGDRMRAHHWFETKVGRTAWVVDASADQFNELLRSGGETFPEVIVARRSELRHHRDDE